MTSTQEMVMTLFTKETINRVRRQFRSGEEIVGIDSFDMTFRLFKPGAENINLELLIQMPVGTGEEQDFSGIGRARVQQMVMFFKPIGYFTRKKGLLSTEIEVTIIKEFEQDLDFLSKNDKIPSGIRVHKLSLEENAVIAAFSMDSLLQAQKYRDSSFRANGLDVDIYMTFDNEYPQSFLDDKYALKGHIAAYFLRGANQTIAPNIEREASFKKLHAMSLLSAFKRFG